MSFPSGDPWVRMGSGSKRVTSFFSCVFKTELYTVTGYWCNFRLLCMSVLYCYLPSLAIIGHIQLVGLCALIRRSSVSCRFSYVPVGLWLCCHPASLLGVNEVTLHPNVPWPACVGPISGIPVLSFTGFSAWRVIICGNGFPPFRLFQYPGMNIIPVPLAYSGWVWPYCSPLECEQVWHWCWSVPILSCCLCC